MDSNIFERVKKIVENIINDDSIEITEESSFFDDLGISSLDVLLIISDIEYEFNIEVPDCSLKEIATIEDAINMVKKLEQ